MEFRKGIIFPQTVSADALPSQGSHSEGCVVEDIQQLVSRWQVHERDMLENLKYSGFRTRHLRVDHQKRIVADVRLLLKPELHLYSSLERWYEEIVIEVKKIHLYHNAARLDRELLATSLTSGFNYRLNGFPECYDQDVDAARRAYKRLCDALSEDLEKYWLCYYFLDLLSWIKKSIFMIEKEGVHKTLEKVFGFPPLQQSSIETTISGPPEASPSSKSLSLRQIALFCIHSGEILDNKSAKQLAKHHGLNSGEKVMQFYNKFHNTTSRTKLDGKLVKPMIDDLKAILPYLTSPQRDAVEYEINTLSQKMN